LKFHLDLGMDMDMDMDKCLDWDKDNINCLDLDPLLPCPLRQLSPLAPAHRLCQLDTLIPPCHSNHVDLPFRRHVLHLTYPLLPMPGHHPLPPEHPKTQQHANPQLPRKDQLHPHVISLLSIPTPAALPLPKLLRAYHLIFHDMFTTTPTC
jgi:hypothetical protein